MVELADLLDREIPDGRQHLQESFMNLEKVAKYCKDNYEQVSHSINLTNKAAKPD